MASKWFVKKEDLVEVSQKPGLKRRTMAYNKDVMMCLFEQETGAVVEQHTHAAAQSGYVLSGRVKFIKADGSYAIVEPGGSYAFEANEPHGSLCLEHALFLECFTPLREEYI